MIETEEIAKRSEKSYTVEEEILGEALTSCHTVMKDLAEADDVELTVMWRVLEVRGYQRLVKFQFVFSYMNRF